MGKWADYVITGVRYDLNEKHIVEVQVRADTGTNLGPASRVSRQYVVTAIERGVSFVTAYSRDGQWWRGEDVRVVVVGGVKYLRTDRNAVWADNLGALPRLARAVG